MNIIGTFPTEELFALSVHPKARVRVLGHKFNIENLKIFAVHGCSCVRCGRTGDRVVAWVDRGGSYHMDLFAKEGDKLVLMNRDHILPRSLKGTNDIWNLQPMCVRCNSKKGNVMTAADHQMREFRAHWLKIYKMLRTVVCRTLWRVARNGKNNRASEHHLWMMRASYRVAKLTNVFV
jgi:5-methylcytosine-specific restriction endonuclease McrA